MKCNDAGCEKDPCPFAVERLADIVAIASRREVEAREQVESDRDRLKHSEKEYLKAQKEWRQFRESLTKALSEDGR
jgi:hypothetical protein